MFWGIFSRPFWRLKLLELVSLAFQGLLVMLTMVCPLAGQQLCVITWGCFCCERVESGTLRPSGPSLRPMPGGQCHFFTDSRNPIAVPKLTGFQFTVGNLPNFKACQPVIQHLHCKENLTDVYVYRFPFKMMYQKPTNPEAALRSMKLLFHGPKASSRVGLEWSESEVWYWLKPPTSDI